MSMTNSLADGDQSAVVTRLVHAHWRAFLAEGVLLIVIGLAAMAIPPIAGLAATVVLGWVLLAAGAVGLVATLRARQAPGFAWAVVSAILALAAGLVLLWNPLAGLVTLTYVLIAFFIADGVVNILLGIAHRRDMSGKWEWIVVNGVIDLVLAGIILSGMPGTLVWALGLLIGIDLLFGGASLIAVALNARRETTA
jgi:uncharacterized membrane protein HdeD (DUF308 family)